MLMSVVWALAGIGVLAIVRYLLKRILAAIKASGLKKVYFGAEFYDNEKASTHFDK